VEAALVPALGDDGEPSVGGEAGAAELRATAQVDARKDDNAAVEGSDSAKEEITIPHRVTPQTHSSHGSCGSCYGSSRGSIADGNETGNEQSLLNDEINADGGAVDGMKQVEAVLNVSFSDDEMKEQTEQLSAQQQNLDVSNLILSLDESESDLASQTGAAAVAAESATQSNFVQHALLKGKTDVFMATATVSRAASSSMELMEYQDEVETSEEELEEDLTLGGEYATLGVSSQLDSFSFDLPLAAQLLAPQQSLRMLQNNTRQIIQLRETLLESDQQFGLLFLRPVSATVEQQQQQSPKKTPKKLLRLDQAAAGQRRNKPKKLEEGSQLTAALTEVKVEGNSRYQCSLCQKSFKLKPNAVKHLKVFHLLGAVVGEPKQMEVQPHSAQPKGVPAVVKVQKPQKSLKEKRMALKTGEKEAGITIAETIKETGGTFECQSCHKIFGAQRSARTHVRYSCLQRDNSAATSTVCGHPVRLHPSTICTTKFDKPKSFERHLRELHGLQKCRYCDLVLSITETKTNPQSVRTRHILDDHVMQLCTCGQSKRKRILQLFVPANPHHQCQS